MGHPVIDELVARCESGAVMAGSNSDPKGGCDVLVIDGPQYTAHEVGLRLMKYAPVTRRFIVIGVPVQFKEYAGVVPGVIAKDPDNPPRIAGVLPAVRGWLKEFPDDWKPIAHHLPDGLGILVLARDASAAEVIGIGSVPSVPPPGLPPKLAGGVGSELKALTAVIGLSADDLPNLPDGCPGCENLAHQMDLHGPAWVEKHRGEIEAQLRAAWAEVPWALSIGVAMRAAGAGLATKVSWADPAPGLLREAERRWAVRVAAFAAGQAKAKGK